MEKKYRILSEFIKDISAETKDIESYIYTKENISKYKMFIDINTKPLKNKMAEVSISTNLKRLVKATNEVTLKWYMLLSSKLMKMLIQKKSWNQFF